MEKLQKYNDKNMQLLVLEEGFSNYELNYEYSEEIRDFFYDVFQIPCCLSIDKMEMNYKNFIIPFYGVLKGYGIINKVLVNEFGREIYPLYFCKIDKILNCENDKFATFKIIYKKEIIKQLKKLENYNYDFEKIINTLNEYMKYSEYFLNVFENKKNKEEKLKEFFVRRSSLSYIKRENLRKTSFSFDKKESEFPFIEKKSKEKSEKKEFSIKEEIPTLTLEQEETINLIMLNANQVSQSEKSKLNEWLTYVKKLPWNKFSENEKNNLESVKKRLNDTHYGLYKAKEEFLRYFVSEKNKKDKESSIICLVGNPGIGKTSLASSIANALGKEFASISIGGITEPEILNGFGYTYASSTYGAIIREFLKLKTNDPVILLDEIDKTSLSVQNALSEILDYSINNKFVDKYLRVPFDLSKTLFITTANDVSLIPDYLKNRMKIITLDDYSIKEKKVILKEYLLPKEISKYNIKNEIKIDDKVIDKICYEFCDDFGVRKLKENAKEIISNVLLEIEEANISENKIICINEKNIFRYIKKESVTTHLSNINNKFSKIYGMAILGSKGVITEYEIKKIKGNFDIISTGNIIDTFKETIEICKNFIKTNSEYFGIKISELENENNENRFYLHLPNLSIPKNGPSGGLAVSMLILKELNKINLKENIAVTGEITLEGNVIAVGGINKKILGSFKAGIRKFIIPYDNLKDGEKVAKEIKENYNIDVDIIAVKSIFEAIEILNKESETENHKLYK